MKAFIFMNWVVYQACVAIQRLKRIYCHSVKKLTTIVFILLMYLITLNSYKNYKEWYCVFIPAI